MNRPAGTAAIVAADPDRVEQIIRGASLAELLVALDADATADDYFADGVTRYRCPSCQCAGWTPAHAAPSVTIIDRLAVECSQCGLMTRWYLQRRVFEDVTAVVRISNRVGLSA